VQQNQPNATRPATRKQNKEDMKGGKDTQMAEAKLFDKLQDGN
jgi:hypothetical protein